MTENQAKPVHRDAGSVWVPMRQRQSDDVALAIAGAQMHGAATGSASRRNRHAASGADGLIDLSGSLLCVRRREQPAYRHVNMLRIAKEAQPIVPGDP